VRFWREHSWLAVLAAVALLVLLAAGAREADWWRDVVHGCPLELESLSVAELPLPLLESYGQNRWHEGIDALYDAETGLVYVLVRWGERPTGGYRIEPLSASLVRRLRGWQVRIKAEFVVPAPGQPVIEVLTFPAAGVRVDLGELRPHRLRVVVVDQRGKLKGSSPELPE